MKTIKDDNPSKKLKKLSKKRFLKNVVKHLEPQFRMRDPFDSHGKCGHYFKDAKEYFELFEEHWEAGNIMSADHYLTQAFASYNDGITCLLHASN